VEAVKPGWIIFAYGNKVPFMHDMRFCRGVPGGVYFEPQKGWPDADHVHLRAPGYGMLGHRDVEGHSMYGSGAISVSRTDLNAALKDGNAEVAR
jgi:hypothetical protein